MNNKYTVYQNHLTKKKYNKYGLGEYIKYNNKDGVIINVNNNNTYNII